MNITIDAATASIVTAIIVGLVSAATTIIANRYSMAQQKAQWQREERRAEWEAREAEKVRELELKKATTKELQEIYGNAIASLTTLLIYNDASLRLKPEYAPNLAETQRWLSQVVTVHYDKNSTDYKEFIRLYHEAKDSYRGMESIKSLRDMMIEFTSKDPRLSVR